MRPSISLAPGTAVRTAAAYVTLAEPTVSVVADHSSSDLYVIPDKWIRRAKRDLPVVYRARRWDAAAEARGEVLAAKPEDGPAQSLLERIEAFRKNQPDDE
jgi:hypothetical protein